MGLRVFVITDCAREKRRDCLALALFDGLVCQRSIFLMECSTHEIGTKIVSEEAKKAIADLPRRKALERLKRDGSTSAKALQRRVQAIAEERKISTEDIRKDPKAGDHRRRRRARMDLDARSKG